MMDVKSIYLTSNSFSHKYPSNNRSSFLNHIDEQELQYINGKSLYIGLKELTMENSYNIFHNEYGKPNMIIVQDHHGIIADTRHFRILNGPDMPEIDISSGLDYYFMSEEPPPYRCGKHEKMRNFTDVKISIFLKSSVTSQYARYVVHNLYFHDSPLQTEKELITYLNQVYQYRI